MAFSQERFLDMILKLQSLSLWEIKVDLILCSALEIHRFGLKFLRLAAYSAGRTNNKELAKKVWNTLLLEPGKSWMTIPMTVDKVDEKEYIKPVKEIPWIQANTLSQWSLNTIMALEFIDEYLPEDITNSKIPTAHA